MRLFSLLDFQHMVLAFFLGLGLLMLVYLAWGSYFPRRKELHEKEPGELKEDELGREGYEKGNPIAPVLIIIYIGIVVWSISYMIVIGIRGTAF